jgi:hypothetical protein
MRFGCLEAAKTHPKSENGDGVTQGLPGQNRGEKRREWGGGGGPTCCHLEKEGGGDVCVEWVPRPAAAWFQRWRMVLGGMEQGRRGSGRVGHDWAVAVGRPKETVRFLIYSN